MQQTQKNKEVSMASSEKLSKHSKHSPRGKQTCTKYNKKGKVRLRPSPLIGNTWRESANANCMGFSKKKPWFSEMEFSSS